MLFKIIYVINHEDDVIAYPVVTFSFFQHHGTGCYLSLLRLASICRSPRRRTAKRGGRPAGAFLAASIFPPRAFPPTSEFLRPSLYESLGPATKTQNVTHRSCQGYLKISPPHFRGDFACRLILKKSLPHGTGEAGACGRTAVVAPLDDGSHFTVRRKSSSLLQTVPSRAGSFGEKM